MIFAGIVAGGKGLRMKNADKPKQFLDVGGAPILIITVRAFLAQEEIDRIYIGINPDWHDYADSLLRQYELDCGRIRLVDGGADRNATVMKIVDSITDEYGVNGGDVLVTHDAVRPFVSSRIIRENIECAKRFSVCGTYIPSADTVVKSSDGESVEENLDRSQLFRVQTPQSFEIQRLCQCRERLGEETISHLTDTCGIFTLCSIPIHMVQGEDSNFKITTDFDLAAARGLI